MLSAPKVTIAVPRKATPRKPTPRKRVSKTAAA
jgi:hypothetical protein